MYESKIPKTPIPIYITGKSGSYYDQFKAYNIDDIFEINNLNSSVIITLKGLKSMKGDLSVTSDLSISYHAIQSIDDQVGDCEYNFMTLSNASILGAKHFFLLRWGNQIIREQIMNDIKDGGYCDFHKDEEKAIYCFKGWHFFPSNDSKCVFEYTRERCV